MLRVFVHKTLNISRTRRARMEAICFNKWDDDLKAERDVIRIQMGHRPEGQLRKAYDAS